jgi:hypothetical protein
MKRMLAALLMLLLLTGCNLVEPGGTNPAGDTTAATQPTEPGIYHSASDVEEATHGAVRHYLVDGNCHAVAVVGGNVVLFYENELRAYAGDELRLVKALSMQTTEFPGYPDVQVTADAMGYYDEAAHAVVMLNASLKEVARVRLPEDVQGGFVLADTLDVLYYCTADAVRGYNLKTGTSHLLRQQSYDAQLLKQNCFGGDILGCEIYTRDRNYIAYISAKTGELLGSAANADGLSTGGEYYFLPVADGESVDYLFGVMGEAPQCLHPDLENTTIHTALPMGGVFTEKQDNGLHLSYYDLTSGRKTAAVTLPGVAGAVMESWADAENNCLWLLVGDSAGADALYRWDLKKSASGDETVYSGPRYTAKNPDTEGLAQCAADAAALGQKYGVEITIGDAPAGCAYALTEEYRVERVREGLTALDAALARYPEGVLPKLASGKLRLILVRQIHGQRNACQYWSGDTACVVVELGDDLTAAVDNGVYHVLDTYLFNHSSILDQWADMNPKGFKYDMNDADYVNRKDESHLAGEKRSFVDSLSMSYPVEDRAAVFAAAMGTDNQEVFSGDRMQQKLLTLCKAIRDAFKWKKSEENYIWEQYLTESIAYKPKK